MTMRPFQVARRLRLFLRVDPGPHRGPADFRRAAVGVVWLVRFFYLFIAWSMHDRLHLSRVLERGTPTDPLWPIALLNELAGAGWVVRASSLPVVPIACSLVGLLAMVFPGVLIWRLGIFLYLLVFVALDGSYGAVNHGRHFLIYVGFALLFLPPTVGSARMSRRDAMDCVMVFWLAQSVPLLAYSLSGFWKIYGSGLELLSPDGFIRILLDRAMWDTRPLPPMLPLAVKHPALAQLLFLGAIYMQLSAILALFRPHLHRPLGIALILFHLGTGWLMNIDFHYNRVVVGLLLIFSPFAPARFSWLGLGQSLPVLGIPFRLWAASGRAMAREGKAWLVYDGECPLCRGYARRLDVERSVGELILVDARQGGPVVEEIRSLPWDLNDGMALKTGGRHYLGDDALHVLALLSGGRGVFSTMNRLLFGSRATARLVYPLLKLGRRALLRLKGVAPIDG